MKTKAIASVFLIMGMMLGYPCHSQAPSDLSRANKAYRALRKASVVNGISTGLALASNLEMIIIGGFPLEYSIDEDQATVILSHMPIAVGRVLTSLAPPCKVARARKALKPWRMDPEMAQVNQKLFARLDAAQVLTALAPVLCISGGAMMFRASMIDPYSYRYDSYSGHAEFSPNPKFRTLKTVGWICVGAGLVASVSGEVMIVKARKELAKSIGALKLSAGPDGVGIKYNLPVGNGGR